MNCAASEIPEGYFSVCFLEMTPSRYSSKAVLRSGLTQESVLATSQFCSIELNHEIEESIAEAPLYRLFPDNPLNMRFYLDSIGNGNNYFILSLLIISFFQITQLTIFVMNIVSKKSKFYISHRCQVF